MIWIARACVRGDFNAWYIMRRARTCTIFAAYCPLFIFIFATWQFDKHRETQILRLVRCATFLPLFFLREMYGGRKSGMERSRDENRGNARRWKGRLVEKKKRKKKETKEMILSLRRENLLRKVRRWMAVLFGEIVYEGFFGFGMYSEFLRVSRGFLRTCGKPQSAKLYRMLRVNAVENEDDAFYNNICYVCKTSFIFLFFFFFFNDHYILELKLV